MNKFWKWKNQLDSGKRTLVLDGTIAEESWLNDDISPKDFRRELEGGSGDLDLWINSPGGDCIAAAQIYNMLREYSGKVTVKIDGIAASAASVVAMAGDEVQISPVGMLMIHNPWTIAAGDAGDFEQAINMLDSVKETIVNAYELKTGLSRAKLGRLMDDETWMAARKAIELGFADSMTDRVGFIADDEADGAFAFSQKTADFRLLNSMKKHKEEFGRSVAVLRERLDAMKKFI